MKGLATTTTSTTEAAVTTEDETVSGAATENPDRLKVTLNIGVVMPLKTFYQRDYKKAMSSALAVMQRKKPDLFAQIDTLGQVMHRSPFRSFEMGSVYVNFRGLQNQSPVDHVKLATFVRCLWL
ncbi:unnamed protein product [Bemisia tabaci]|uniref:Uncharacterized protein n=1 Tax=Bemisia tabaci TaxID=7038 RepID=A0A9P0A183_BEMTA|nr:unnamed protein product [Bemisia tabaci]